MGVLFCLFNGNIPIIYLCMYVIFSHCHFTIYSPSTLVSQERVLKGKVRSSKQTDFGCRVVLLPATEMRVSIRIPVRGR